MCYDFGAICQAGRGSFPFWLETLSIFLGDVLAAVFGVIGGSVLWYLVKYPGFRVGANWSFVGWDAEKMGRLPNESDTGSMELVPNISVTTHDMAVKKLISAVWVRERADVNDPGEILGHRDLLREGVPVVARTTGGDLLKITGPRIKCDASAFKTVTVFPIFIQTSDGEFYQAQSPGNVAKGIVKLRFEIQRFVYGVKQRLLK